jgi:co-chaperonin GroES (HSP10)
MSNRAPIDLSKQTPVSEGAVRGMACIQGDKELIAVGKNILVRIEPMSGLTAGGLHIPDNAKSERSFVLSIGSNVDVANADGKKLEVGDEILAATLSFIPVFDPIKGEKKGVKFLGENDVIAIVGK